MSDTVPISNAQPNPLTASCLLVEEATDRYQIISEMTSDFAYCFRVEPAGMLVLEWMTESVTRTMGYTVEDINARGWQSFLYPEDALIVLNQLQRLLSGQTDISEFRVWADNNTLLWLRNHTRPVWDATEKRVIRIYGAAQDITERKQAEHERERLVAEIEALNQRLRQTMRESFHRIKNNLQRVTSLIQMYALEHHGVLPEEQVQQLSAHIRVLAAVHDLLTQGVREDGQAQVVSTKALLKRLFALLGQMEGEQRLRYQLTDVKMVECQAASLALITNELLQNALKHSSGIVTVRFAVAKKQAILDVWDEGAGFPANFDPVRSARTGLRLVEDLAACDLNAQVRYLNRREGGAQVRLLLPIPV